MPTHLLKTYKLGKYLRKGIDKQNIIITNSSKRVNKYKTTIDQFLFSQAALHNFLAHVKERGVYTETEIDFLFCANRSSVKQ